MAWGQRLARRYCQALLPVQHRRAMAVGPEILRTFPEYASGMKVVMPDGSLLRLGSSAIAGTGETPLRNASRGQLDGDH